MGVPILTYIALRSALLVIALLVIAPPVVATTVGAPLVIAPIVRRVSSRPLFPLAAMALEAP